MPYLPLSQLALEKAEDNQIQEMKLEVFRVQEQLVKFHTKLEDHHHSKAEAEAKHWQAQDQLEATKSQHSSLKSQESKAKARGETDMPFGVVGSKTVFILTVLHLFI